MTSRCNFFVWVDSIDSSNPQCDCGCASMRGTVAKEGPNKVRRAHMVLVTSPTGTLAYTHSFIYLMLGAVAVFGKTRLHERVESLSAVHTFPQRYVCIFGTELTGPCTTLRAGRTLAAPRGSAPISPGPTWSRARPARATLAVV